MSLISNTIRLSVLSAAAFIITSCTVVVEEGPVRPTPPRPDRPQFCTQQYEPVCAVRGDRQRTFGNACTARAEGWRPIHPAECRRRPPQSERPDRVCTREYAPVCARRGNSVRTFGNACSARAQDYRILHRGECR